MTLTLIKGMKDKSDHKVVNKMVEVSNCNKRNGARQGEDEVREGNTRRVVSVRRMKRGLFTGRKKSGRGGWEK